MSNLRLFAYNFMHAESCPFVPGHNKSKPTVPCDNEQEMITSDLFKLIRGLRAYTMQAIVKRAVLSSNQPP